MASQEPTITKPVLKALWTMFGLATKVDKPDFSQVPSLMRQYADALETVQLSGIGPQLDKMISKINVLAAVERKTDMELWEYNAAVDKVIAPVTDAVKKSASFPCDDPEVDKDARASVDASVCVRGWELPCEFKVGDGIKIAVSKEADPDDIRKIAATLSQANIQGKYTQRAKRSWGKE